MTDIPRNHSSVVSNCLKHPKVVINAAISMIINEVKEKLDIFFNKLSNEEVKE